MEDVIAHEENGPQGAFVIARDGKRFAELTYLHSSDSVIVINHTFVDPGLRGHGVARKLLDAAVAWARKSQLRINPECSYVRAVFARDASIRDVLA